MAVMMVLCLLAIKVETYMVLGQSLSRLKTVTMSSQHRDWVGSRAVDGNYNREIDGCAATSTDNLVDQWMEIDLGETTEFNRIVVYGQNSAPYTRQNLIGLSIHLDGSKTGIAFIEDTGQGYVNFHHFDLGQKYSARRVKLILKGSNKVLMICEVDVFNDSIISNGKNVTAISTYSNWDPSYAVDGDMGTNPDGCLCCAATNLHTDPWLNVDLGDVYLITYIQMYGRKDNQVEGQSFEGMKITVDDVVIQTVPTTGTFISYYEVFPTPEKIGRNVKFTLTGTGRLITMCEIVIYGDHFNGKVISNHQPAKISSIYQNWASSRAVDGDYRTYPAMCHCCTATAYQANPWLRVDLGFEHRLTRVVIYGRTDIMLDGQNFAGLVIKLDSSVIHTIPTSTNWIDFYEYPLATVRLATSVTLTLVGPKQQLVVCELLVYGDSKKSFDSDSCSTLCKGELCPTALGISPSGRCEPEYQGTTCSKHCKKSFYSDSCSRKCHCEGEPCTTTSGVCPSGRCEPGYQTETCSKPCDTGAYGQDCLMQCGNCKDDQICDHVTGYCGDCKPGYIMADPLCKTPCIEGRYSYNCTGLCGRCRQDEPCDIATGHCKECKDGYTYSDPFCKTACRIGTYGMNCTETCGNCRGGEICGAVNGYCTACRDGYMETDRTCKTRCPIGSYGRNCAMSCGTCSGGVRCNYVDGSCEDCMNGTYVFDDKLCSKACKPHTYGYNCTGHCGNCRDGVPCNTVNGSCVECEDGYTNADSRCHTGCSNGTFGQNCQHACGMCTCGEACDSKTGKCPNGCSHGYLGDACLQRISQDESTETTIGLPVYIGSMIASNCVTLAITLTIVYWKLWRIHSSSSKREEANEARDPAPSTQSEAASNYDSLKLSNIQSESDYSELQ